MASPKEQVLEDCINFVGRRVVFSDGLMRLQYFQQFEELYCQEDSLSSLTYGRLYNISEITECLVILTQAARPKNERPYVVDVPEEKNLIPKTIVFETWRPSDWKSFREGLVKIQTSMLRSDATASIHEILSNEGENKQVDPQRANDPWLNSRFFRVLELIKLHEKLAPFRLELENRSSAATEKGTASEPLSLPRKLFLDFLDMVATEDKKRTKKAFLALLNEKEDTFYSLGTIRRVLDDPSQPLSFAFVLNRVNQILRAWTETLLEDEGTTEVEVEPSRKTDSPDSGKARALKKLQRARARLNENVDDPLASAVKTAAGAKRSRRRNQKEQDLSEDMPESNEDSDEDDAEEKRPLKVSKKSPIKSPGKNMLGRKKSAVRLTFTPEKESDSEDIEDPKEEKEDDEVLPSLKRPAKIASPGKKRRSQQKMYEGKRFWSDAEKAAVIQGIAHFGVGRWAQIKEAHFMTLKFRTSGQIKDCYRTLKKRGELGDLVEPSPKKSTAAQNEAEQENAGEQEEEKNADEETNAEEEKNPEEDKEDAEDKKDGEEKVTEETIDL